MKNASYKVDSNLGRETEHGVSGVLQSDNC